MDEIITINGQEFKPEAIQAGEDGEGYYVVIRMGHSINTRSDWDRLRVALGIFPDHQGDTSA